MFPQPRAIISGEAGPIMDLPSVVSSLYLRSTQSLEEGVEIYSGMICGEIHTTYFR